MSEQSTRGTGSARRTDVTSAQSLLAEVNESTGRAWQLDARFARGALGGAWRVQQGATIAVFRWHDAASNAPYNPDAPAIVEFLRDAGYPTPAWLASGKTADGVVWSIQDLVDGEPLRELDVRSADLFLELVGLQRTLTLPTQLSWNEHMRRRVFGAHPSHRLLADGGGAVARLLHAALQLASPYETSPLVDSEMVHSDLNVSNVLVHDGRLVGVVDIDGAGRGCTAYDLLSPAVNGVSWGSDPRAVDRLVHYGLETYGPGPIAIATACLLIENTTWYQSSDPSRIEQRARRHLEWLQQIRPALA